MLITVLFFLLILIMDVNHKFLNGIVDEIILDEVEKNVKVRKTRSKDDDGDDAVITASMLKGIMYKYNKEIAGMIVTQSNESKGDIAKVVKKVDDNYEEIQTKLNTLMDLIDNVGQYTRRDNIKILGIKHTENEKLPEFFCDVVKHNGVDMKEEYLSTIHRLNTRDDKEDTSEINARGGNKKIPSMIARLTHRDVKNEIFNTRKQIKEKNGSPYPDAFIVEDVTPLRSRILYSLRNRLDSKGDKVFKFVWTRDGRIFCRTEEESQRRDGEGQIKQAKPHIINKADDLLALGWSKKEVNDIRYNIRA